LDRLAGDTKGIGLLRTQSRIAHIREYIQADTNRLSTHAGFTSECRLKDEIRVLVEALSDDLNERWIFFPNTDKFNKYFAKFTDHFSAQTVKAFPDAHRDMLAAIHCLTTDMIPPAFFTA
jgi:hypothetical protein